MKDFAYKNELLELFIKNCRLTYLTDRTTESFFTFTFKSTFSIVYTFTSSLTRVRFTRSYENNE